MELRQDSKINFVVVLIVVLSVCLILLMMNYNNNKQISKILTVKSELELISKQLKKFYNTYKRYPISLREIEFAQFIDGITIIDPFDPERGDYHYRRGNNKWIIYSVGPNKVDDGGIAQKNGQLFDIVVEETIRQD